MAVLTFRSQAVLTILEIWLGERLPDGATLEMPLVDPGVSGGGAELPGEEYGPLNEAGESSGGGSAPAPKPGTVEQWGVEERSL